MKWPSANRKLKRRSGFLLAVAFMFSSLPALAGPEPTDPTLVHIATYRQGATTQFYQRFIKEAYLRAGLDVQFDVMPVARATRSVSRGDADALLLASLGEKDNISDIVKVTEPLPAMTFRVIANTSFPEDSLPPDLGKHRVGYIHGVHPLDRIFADKKNKLTIHGGLNQFISLMRFGRIELAVFPALEAEATVNRFPRLKMLEKPVYEFEIYHYLHREHQNMAEELSEAFRALKQEGCAAHLMQEVVPQDMKNGENNLLGIINAPDYTPICGRITPFPEISVPRR